MPIAVKTLVNGVVRPPSVNIGGKGAKAAINIKRETDKALDRAAFLTTMDYRQLLRRRGYNNFTVRGALYVGHKKARAAAATRRISKPVRAIYLMVKQAEYLSRQILGGRGSKRLSYVRTAEYEGHVIAPKGQRGRKLGGLVRRLKKTSGVAARSARLAVVPRRDGGDGHTVREKGRFRGWITPRTFYKPRLQWASYLRPKLAGHAKLAIEQAHKRSLKKLARGLVGM